MRACPAVQRAARADLRLFSPLLPVAASTLWSSTTAPPPPSRPSPAAPPSLILWRRRCVRRAALRPGLTHRTGAPLPGCAAAFAVAVQSHWHCVHASACVLLYRPAAAPPQARLYDKVAVSYHGAKADTNYPLTPELWQSLGGIQVPPLAHFSLLLQAVRQSPGCGPQAAACVGRLSAAAGPGFERASLPRCPLAGRDAGAALHHAGRAPAAGGAGRARPGSSDQRGQQGGLGRVGVSGSGSSSSQGPGGGAHARALVGRACVGQELSACALARHAPQLARSYPTLAATQDVPGRRLPVPTPHRGQHRRPG